MSHEVIRTINGRRYRYLEESYRVPGLRTPRKRSTYLGPVDPFDGLEQRKRKPGLFGVIDDLVRRGNAWEHRGETPEDERARLAAEDMERARTDRNNQLLAGNTISLDALAEVAASQQDDRQESSASDRSAATEAASATDAVDDAGGDA